MGGMAFFFLYLAVRALLGALVRSRREGTAAQSLTFTGATGSVASSTSTTKPPHELRHRNWRPSRAEPMAFTVSQCRRNYLCAGISLSVL
jgi:hypothetical protein